jgi:hypothetical protein
VQEKYTLSMHQAFDISAHIGNAFQAALQQAANGQPRYGQGWGAYGERFAANEGDQITGSILIYGVLPSILHEDPQLFSARQGIDDCADVVCDQSHICDAERARHVLI